MESLPYELLQTLANYLPPDAIDMFTLTSKHIPRVLLPLISRHRGLKREFGHAVCGKAKSHRCIARLLILVLARRELRFYIRKLTIHDWHNDMNPAPGGNQLDRRPVDYRQEIFESTDEDPASIKRKVATFPTKASVFLLLLWSLTELRTLRLLGGPDDELAIFNVIYDIIISQSEPSRHAFPPSLQNLRNFQLGSDTEGGTWTIAIAKWFSYLPSLKSLSVVGIDDCRGIGWKDNYSAKSSNVKS